MRLAGAVLLLLAGVGLALATWAGRHPSHPPVETVAHLDAVVEPAEPQPAPMVDTRPVGPLTGMVVVLSPGHGRLEHLSVREHQRSLGYFFQRPARNGLQEDLWTSRFVVDHLAPAFEAAGAIVLSLRERDLHAVSVHASLGPDAPTATLVAPQAGRWRLYARWQADAGDVSAKVVIKTGTGRQVVDIDTTRHHGVWWPLGGVDLETTVDVGLHAEGPLPRMELRLGGGSFEIEVGGRTRRTPWHEVAALHHLPQLGGPEALLRLDDGRRISDMRFRARWASWAVDPADEAVFLSIHTNAGRGVGSAVFYGHDPDSIPPRGPEPHSRHLAEQVADSMGGALVDRVPSWRHRGVRLGNFSEISPHWNAVPAAMIELGFHDHRADAALLLDPVFQDAAAVGIVAGVARWR